MEKRTFRANGFTLVEIMIVVAIIGLLAAVAIPNLTKARNEAQAKACVSNLRTIEAAKELWALEKGQSGAVVASAEDLKPYIGRGSGGTLPICPVDSSRTFATSYSINPLNVPPTCIASGATAGHSLIVN